MNTAEANAQHYEIPAEFFALVLGPQRKYSCCLYDEGVEHARRRRGARAQASAPSTPALADGQRILELGCGWGSLSLWMARHYPAARITSVSNSQSQRAFIAGRAKAEGLANLDVVTADMNAFCPAGRFDRVVSVEMFEHMANWRPLLRRVRDCLEAGRPHVHARLHQPRTPLPLRRRRQGRLDRAALFHRRHHAEPRPDPAVPRSLFGRSRNGAGTAATISAPRRLAGRISTATARRSSRCSSGSMAATRSCGSAAGGCSSWRRRDLFGHAGGEEWGVSHYRLAPVR